MHTPGMLISLLQTLVHSLDFPLKHQAVIHIRRQRYHALSDAVCRDGFSATIHQRV